MSPVNDHLANTTVAQLVAACAPTSPTPFFVGIDGRSGAGKTTLANNLATELCRAGRRVSRIEVEEFIGGWTALATDLWRVADLLAALRRTGTGAARVWDWEAHAWGAQRTIPAEGSVDVLILTGCGSTSKSIRSYLDVTVWLEAPQTVRRARVRARDPYDWSGYWEVWARQEENLLRDFPSHLRNDFILQTA